MSPIAATNAELTDAAIEAAWNDPDNSSEVSFEALFEESPRVQCHIVDGPDWGMLNEASKSHDNGSYIGLTRFKLAWSVQGRFAPVQIDEVWISVTYIERESEDALCVYGSGWVVIYYPERCGVPRSHPTECVPDEFREWLPKKRSGLILRDENEA